MLWLHYILSRKTNIGKDKVVTPPRDELKRAVQLGLSPSPAETAVLYTHSNIAGICRMVLG